MRGILGGMFDPVHFGHLRPARQLARSLGLSEVRMIPCGQPPHRAAAEATGAHRFAMLQAVCGQDGFVADACELERDGPSYTITTLRTLHAVADGPLVLILGADAAAGLPNWNDAMAIPDLCHIAIVARPGAPAPVLPAPWAERVTHDAAVLAHQASGCIYVHAGRTTDCASTAIRAQIKAGQAPHGCVPGRVWAYIRHHRLYGYTETA